MKIRFLKLIKFNQPIAIIADNPLTNKQVSYSHITNSLPKNYIYLSIRLLDCIKSYNVILLLLALIYNHGRKKDIRYVSTYAKIGRLYTLFKKNMEE